jgi:hypothetical protein
LERWGHRPLITPGGLRVSEMVPIGGNRV